MKVTTIFNQFSKTKRVIIYEEHFRNGSRYRVDVFKVTRKCETLKEQIPFKNKDASLAMARIILNKELQYV